MFTQDNKLSLSIWPREENGHEKMRQVTRKLTPEMRGVMYDRREDLFLSKSEYNRDGIKTYSIGLNLQPDDEMIEQLYQSGNTDEPFSLKLLASVCVEPPKDQVICVDLFDRDYFLFTRYRERRFILFSGEANDKKYDHMHVLVEVVDGKEVRRKDISRQIQAGEEKFQFAEEIFCCRDQLVVCFDDRLTLLEVRGDVERVDSLEVDSF